jgi:uncharacterized Zn finger protein
MQQPLPAADPEQREIQDQEDDRRRHREEPYPRAGMVHDGIDVEETKVQNGIHCPTVFAVLGQKSHKVITPGRRSGVAQAEF